MNYDTPHISRYPRTEPLGLSIMSQDINTGEAVQIGVKEGIADSVKFITLGLIALSVYMLLPDKWLNRIQREVRKFQ